MAERKSHDAGKTTLKFEHRIEGSVLDGVSPRFIEWITAGNISLNFLVRVIPHVHSGGAHVLHLSSIRLDQADGRDHLMHGIPQQG